MIRRAPAGVVLDLETCSELDLKRAGAQRYALDCTVLCFAYRIPGQATQAWQIGAPPPAELLAWIAAGKPVKAWNMPFDWAVWNAQLVPQGFPPIRLEQSHCIMARALYWGLPASLDQAGPALELTHRKDKTGHALMMRMARPRAPGRWWHEDEPARLAALRDYCVRDVDAEAEADSKIPDLPAREREIWLLDQAINQRGVRLDRELIDRMGEATAAANQALDGKINRLTNGQVPRLSLRGQLLAWLRWQGYAGADLRRETVLEQLPKATGPVAEGLRLRLDSARTSTAKLRSMRAVAHPADDRARGLIQYYGAGRTGRWAGKLSQPHNLPRPTVKRVDLVVDQLLAGEPSEALELFHEDSALGCIASALRGCFVPAPGCVFVVADLAQIEARVIAWLAGQLDVLKVFASGQDIYTYTANKIGSPSRQLGKTLTLACGFQMGPMRFQSAAAAFGLVLPAADAEAAVLAWRRANPRIVALWYDYDRAAREVIAGQSGTSRRVRDVLFELWHGHLLVTLPGGRQLVYRDVRLDPDPLTGRTVITYLGVDQKTRQWGRIKTYGGKFAENFTQAVARDVLAEALLTVDRAGLCRPVLSVHDEIIGEAPRARAADALTHLLAVLRRAPRWAAGLPVGAEGATMLRYGK